MQLEMETGAASVWNAPLNWKQGLPGRNVTGLDGVGRSRDQTSSAPGNDDDVHGGNDVGQRNDMSWKAVYQRRMGELSNDICLIGKTRRGQSDTW